MNETNGCYGVEISIRGPGKLKAKWFAAVVRTGRKTMKNITAALAVLAGALALASTNVSAQSAPKSGVTITGTVTCSKYVNSTPYQKGMTQTEAIHMCISQGYSYVIVSGKNVYRLQGDSKQLAKLAGDKVTVVGYFNTDEPKGPEYAYQGTVQGVTITPSAD
jgi:hypothetical protein